MVGSIRDYLQLIASQNLVVRAQRTASRCCSDRSQSFRSRSSQSLGVKGRPRMTKSVGQPRICESNQCSSVTSGQIGPKLGPKRSILSPPGMCRSPALASTCLPLLCPCYQWRVGSLVGDTKSKYGTQLLESVRAHHCYYRPGAD